MCHIPVAEPSNNIAASILKMFVRILVTKVPWVKCTTSVNSVSSMLLGFVKLLVTFYCVGCV